MSLPFLNNLDLNLNEIQNAIAQNLGTAPQQGLLAGRFYYDTAKNKFGYYNGTNWVYLDPDSNDNQKIKVGNTTFGASAEIDISGIGAISVAGNNTANTITISIADATTGVKGAVQLTNTVSSGSTVQNLAVTPKGVSEAISTALENYYNKSYIDTTLSNYLTTAAASQTYLTKTDATATYITIASKNQPNGVAGLGSNGKILVGQLPDYLLGQVLYGGIATNIGDGISGENKVTASISTDLKSKLAAKGVITDETITLSNVKTATDGTFGYLDLDGTYFICNAKGTFAGIAYEVGDWIISTGEKWSLVNNSDAVMSVNGKTGTVVLTGEDIKVGGNSTTYKNREISAAIEGLEKSIANTANVTGSKEVTGSFTPSGLTNNTYSITKPSELINWRSTKQFVLYYSADGSIANAQQAYTDVNIQTTVGADGLESGATAKLTFGSVPSGGKFWYYWLFVYGNSNNN